MLEQDRAGRIWCQENGSCKGDIFSPRRHHASGVTGFGKGERLNLGVSAVAMKASNAVSHRGHRVHRGRLKLGGIAVVMEALFFTAGYARLNLGSWISCHGVVGRRP